MYEPASNTLWGGHDENAFRPLPLTECCLQACDWTFWDIICTFDPSHLQLIHITWTNRPSWGSGHKISDCFLPPSHLLRSPAFRSLLSSFLVPIHKYLANMVVHQLHMSWSTLTHPLGKHYTHSIPPRLKSWILNCERLSIPSLRRSNPKKCSRGSSNKLATPQDGIQTSRGLAKQENQLRKGVIRKW